MAPSFSRLALNMSQLMSPSNRMLATQAGCGRQATSFLHETSTLTPRPLGLSCRRLPERGKRHSLGIPPLVKHVADEQSHSFDSHVTDHAPLQPCIACSDSDAGSGHRRFHIFRQWLAANGSGGCASVPERLSIDGRSGFSIRNFLGGSGW